MRMARAGHGKRATVISAGDTNDTNDESEVVKIEGTHRRDDGSAGSPPPMPRWVKVFGIVVGALILLAVAAKFIVGGEHGPGRHGHGGHAAMSQPAS
jgi:hypothetical protein